MPKPKSGRKKNSKFNLQFFGGFRGHMNANRLTWQTIQKDYKKDGKIIDEEYAKKVHTALREYTDEGYREMRKAVFKQRRGEKLTSEEQSWLDKYKLVEEYTKVAPTYKGPGKYLYRGLNFDDGDAYMQTLLSLKQGDKHDFSKIPSSFSSQLSRAQAFANYDGKPNHVVLRIPKNKIKHSPSITGLSVYGRGEMEVLVGDYDWTHAKTFTKTFHDAYLDDKYNITYIYFD